MANLMRSRADLLSDCRVTSNEKELTPYVRARNGKYCLPDSGRSPPAGSGTASGDRQLQSRQIITFLRLRVYEKQVCRKLGYRLSLIVYR